MFVCVYAPLKEQFTETMPFKQHLHIPMQVLSQVKCKHKTENGFGLINIVQTDSQRCYLFSFT